MTDRVCETCRWWAPAVAGKPPLADNTAFACRNPKLAMAHHDIGYESNDCAGIDDGDGVFVTGPRFGCVQWDAFGGAGPLRAASR